MVTLERLSARAFALLCVGYALLSVAWSWPLVTDPLGLDLARHADSPNTLGLAAAVAGASNVMAPERLAWPWGQSLVRGDSFVYFLLARGLGEHHPTLVVALCILVGPVVSALGAERLARALGAGFPWSALAGVVYGFSGTAATSVLEGYGFSLLNPWMPWMVVAALRASGPDGRVRDAVVGAAMWALCLATTAYTGIAASMILAAVVVGGWLRHRRVPMPSVLLSLGVLLLGIGAVAFFLSAPQYGRRFDPDLDTSMAMMTAGSASLGTLLWRTAASDAAVHSQGALVSSLALALSLLGSVLPASPGARRLRVTAAVGIAISLGPALRFTSTDVGVPWLLAPLARWGAGAYFRFPERLHTAVALALGALAAVALTRIAAARPRTAAVLLAAGVLEALVGVGLPFRVARGDWGAPTAYDAAPEGAAVLDVWPRMLGRNVELEARLSRRMVGYAAFHRRPILSNGLNVSAEEDGRAPVSDWLVLRARPDRSAEDADTVAQLRALGIGAVALHPDLYTISNRAWLSDGLTRLFDAPVATSVDHGETVTVWRVASGLPAGGRDDRIAAWTLIHDEVR